jgi:hypothetical protein
MAIKARSTVWALICSDSAAWLKVVFSQPAEPRRILVDPVHDAGPERPADAGKIRQVCKSALTTCVPVARGG